MRTFVDDKGTLWEVREIHVPTLSIVPRRFLPHPEYADGWLLFCSPTERRRIAPLPQDWEELEITELARWCERAAPVRARLDTLFYPLQATEEGGRQPQQLE